MEPCETEMVITLEEPFVNGMRTIHKNHLMEKDQQFIYIQQLIDEKRNILLEKQKHLQKEAGQNEFLEMVKRDYAKYNNYIVQQKREQIQAFEILKKYVDDLNATNKLSKYNMMDAKMEQQKIMAEIESIKKGLAEITKNTDKLDTLIK
jgi:hypothetical protein